MTVRYELGPEPGGVPRGCRAPPHHLKGKQKVGPYHVEHCLSNPAGMCGSEVGNGLTADRNVGRNVHFFCGSPTEKPVSVETKPLPASEEMVSGVENHQSIFSSPRNVADGVNEGRSRVCVR